MIRHLALLTYTVLLCLSMMHHGLWLDEAQVWCLARDSGSLGELFHALRNEGHPPLWPLLVLPLAHLFQDPAAMQVLHAAFAIGAAALVLYRSRLPLLWRVIAVFGYFLVFEYALLARNYGPGMFLLFLAVTLAADGKRQGALVALILLAFLHYWGIVVALAFAVTALLPAEANWSLRKGPALVLALAALVSYRMAWPADEMAHMPALEGVSMHSAWDAVGRTLGQLFVPIPDPRVDAFWNTTWLHDLSPAIGNWVGLGIWCWAVAGLWPQRARVAVLVLTTIGVLAFPVLAPFQGLRYGGPILLVLIAAHWTNDPDRPTTFLRTGLPVALLLQFLGGAVVQVRNAEVPFSQARATAHAIAQGPEAALPVWVDPYQAAPALSAYLGRKVYAPAKGELVGACDWRHRPYDLDREQLVQALSAMPEAGVLLITNDNMPDTLNGLRFTERRAPSGASIRSEDTWTYRVERLR